MRYIINTHDVDYWVSGETYEQMEGIAGRLNATVKEVVEMTFSHLLSNDIAVKTLSHYFVRHTTINGVKYLGGKRPNHTPTDYVHNLRMNINPILETLKTMSYALNMPIRDTLSFVLEVCYGVKQKELTYMK